MKLADLSPAVIERINSFRYDHIGEKHEGPERWSAVLEYYEPEFMQIDGYDVLLPIEGERHANITILRCILSADGQTLTLFLKDTTYNPAPEYEMFYTGRLAICEKMAGTDFYIATVYHEWFIVENAGLRE
ncbi:MAG: hypothetical protein IT324_20320 [Anaerolineae bacterium]|nr:hypothetical protein [Anaerolineae bacterium]